MTHPLLEDKRIMPHELLPLMYRKLMQSTSIRELTDRFAELLREWEWNMPGALLFRAAGESMWQTLLDQSQPGRFSTPAGGEGPREERFPVSDVSGMQSVHRLGDGSEVRVTLDGISPDDHATERDLLSLRAAVAVFDAAYHALLHRQHEKTLAFSLNQRLLQLNSLIDTGIDIATLDGAVDPCNLALERAVALTNASYGVVTVAQEDRVIERIAFPGEPPREMTAPEQPGISTEFVFGTSRYVFSLLGKESRNGTASFEGTDRLLLDALARQVHASLENRFLLRQSLEKQRMEQDLAVAASIQQRILPSTLPVIEGYDMAGINIPSKSVGGDYYDCLALPDGRYALVMADVAGKGIPAALLVSSLHAYLSAYLESGMPLVAMAGRLNTMIHRASTDDKFITAFLGLLDPVAGTLEYVNAGHTVAYCRRLNGAVQGLHEGGIPLGMLDLGLPYVSGRITVQPGDRLFLYTDGIPEAQNSAQELYDSHAPLEQFVARMIPPTAGAFIEDLIADVTRFTAGAPQADDITALYLIRH
jgi:serine phosphatase RsbU (regulator of sigma subunit)